MKLGVVTAEILVKLTERKYQQWQIDTHAAIMQAYLQQRSEYEEKQAAGEVERGIEISGRDPGLNRSLEQTELKKACIALLARQHYSFNAIESVDPESGAMDENGYPQLNIAAGLDQDKTVRFLEHAFEWDQMMYVFYPYFWGRKPRWIDLIHIEDPDPIHAEFLKAGAARVVFPVRPGFENAVQHFIDTNDPWEGGDLPLIGSPVYLPIVEEIKEHQGQSTDEPEPVGEPWPVRLPTSLVVPRKDSSLPKWRKDEEGNWVPDEGEG